MTINRAYTKEETRKRFLEEIRAISRYWATLPGKTEQERCDGVAFSILALIDGVHASFPAVTMSIEVSPDDKEFHLENGENFYEDGTIFNDDCHLHDQYYLP